FSSDPQIITVSAESRKWKERSRYTEREGLRLGLVGWVKNTYSGSVVGQVQGPAEKVWLSKEGSPSSRITRASFTNERAIERLELSGFSTFIKLNIKW
uniref:acylphosphatase n=1 Tax=Myripristis murdjan TaxID=586833 RepID=A0A667Y080_9TELE